MKGLTKDHFSWVTAAFLLVLSAIPAVAQSEIDFDGRKNDPAIERLARDLLLRFKVFDADELRELKMLAFEARTDAPKLTLVVTRVTSPDFCGTLGCFTIVFVADGANWKPALAENFDRLWAEEAPSGGIHLVAEDLHGNKIMADLKKK